MICEICLEYGKQTVALKDKGGSYWSCFECIEELANA
jgi:hypothetical protein